MNAAFGIVLIVLIGAFVVVGLLAVTASWSETFAHGAALRESVRRAGKGK